MATFKGADLGENTLQSLLMTLIQNGNGRYAVHQDEIPNDPEAQTIEFAADNGHLAKCTITFKAGGDGVGNSIPDDEYTFTITGAAQGEDFGS